MIKRKSNNPTGRPTLDGPTEMGSKRIPVSLMNNVRERSVNTTAFIIAAIKEKIQRESSTGLTAEQFYKVSETFAKASEAASETASSIAKANKRLANLGRKPLEEFIKSK